MKAGTPTKSSKGIKAGSKRPASVIGIKHSQVDKAFEILANNGDDGHRGKKDVVAAMHEYGIWYHGEQAKANKSLPANTITIEEALERIDYLITDWKMNIKSFDTMRTSILKRFPTTRTR